MFKNKYFLIGIVVILILLGSNAVLGSNDIKITNVQGVVTEVSTSTPIPTNSPTPTLSPTSTLMPTITPTPTLASIQLIQPTSPQSGLSNDDYYINVDGNKVHSPAFSTDNSAPAGATAICGDGTYSFSQHRRGTCSHHGGVAQWL
ncbi:MAG: DUF3761 domain-containing protein [Patescibacteria group bacterium]|nr:DUF3761 domain-containing protein [Patescibacteria group bacterium]